jgi:hypothetical protein
MFRPAAMRRIALFLLVSLAGCATQWPESAFWGWFQSHAAELKAVRQSDAPIIDTLHQRRPENPGQQGLLPYARLRDVFDDFNRRRSR